MKKIIGLFLLMGLCACSFKHSATITVPSNATTGYTWIVSQDKDLFEIEMDVKEGDGSDQVGVGGQTTIILTPKKEGKNTVTLEYCREWEEEKMHVVELKLSVDSMHKITLEDKKMAGQEKLESIDIEIK